MSHARVILLSRKQESGDEAIKKIQHETSGGANIEFVSIDLGNLKNVREVADRLRKNESRLDIVSTIVAKTVVIHGGNALKWKCLLTHFHTSVACSGRRDRR